MYDVAKEAAAFNMLSLEDHVNDDTYAAYSPNDIGDFCKTFLRARRDSDRIPASGFYCVSIQVKLEKIKL